MAFDQRFLEELRQRIPLHTIIGRKTKLTRSGRNWKACCPFHGEKTPSFYVYDDHFHCFGCGVHGDVISFVMQNEGRSFNETISDLANLAGLEVPEQTPQQKKKVEKQHTLYDVMEAAQEYYCSELDTAKAKAGRDYLLDRGISPEIFREFKLGWSGDGRGGLIDYLKRKGYDLSLIGEAGLLRRKTETEWGGELFFNRVIYPIHDRKGRPIAFGGRILGDGQPKYLNSPETMLFAKRRTLYGLNHLSSVFSRKDIDPLYNTVLVVEGYMDVIALYQAGFHGAVVPLGTALTQGQMQLLWRTTPQPVLCFDGDKAGHRAMLHAAEEALPLLTPEQSLNFLTLPDGEDPDSFIKRNGSRAFLQFLDQKQNFSDAIYDILSATVNNASPEQRASLRKQLFTLSGQIQDKTLAKEYRKILLDRFYEQYYPKNNWQKYGKSSVANDTLKGPRPVIQQQQVDHERICILFALIFFQSSILPDIERVFGQLNLPEKFITLREALFEFAFDETLTIDLIPFLKENGFSRLIQEIMDQPSVMLMKKTLEESSLLLIEKQWWHFYGLLNIHELEKQVEQARREWIECPDEKHQHIFIARLNALEMIKSGEEDEETDDFLL